MGLQNQLNDVSSGSIPLLLIAQIATCVNYLRSIILTILQTLGFSRFNTNQIVDENFLAAFGSGLAGIIMLTDQLTINNKFFYTYEDAAACATGNNGCVVCQNTFKDGEQVRKLPCCHVFHRHCFDGWLHHYKFNCPLCRSPLISDQRVALTQRRVGRQLIEWFSIR